MTNLVRMWLRCFATAAAVAGPILGVLAIAFALHTSHFIHRATHTKGSVTALTAQTDQYNNLTYAPTFTFKTPAGETITKRSGTGSKPPTFTTGQQVPVLFDPNYPQDARIDTRVQLWTLPIAFGILSMVFTPIGILLLRGPWIRTAPSPFLSRTTADNV